MDRGHRRRGRRGGGAVQRARQPRRVPRVPTGGNLTTGGIIVLVAVAVISLVGAPLGGSAGMRYHRKVDKAAFEPTPG